MKITQRLKAIKIIPVIKLNDENDAIDLADALSAGGLPSMEITLRTGCALGAIKKVSSARPDILLGAGTVLTTEQAAAAVEAGVDFIVSPGTNPKVVSWCLEHNVTIIPGCATPTDIELAMGFGLDVLKFFPAEAYGGVKTLKALSAPYGNIKFMPTGGISLENLSDYLSLKSVLACGGSFMVNDTLLVNKSFNEITSICRLAVDIAKQI